MDIECQIMTTAHIAGGDREDFLTTDSLQSSLKPHLTLIERDTSTYGSFTNKPSSYSFETQVLISLLGVELAFRKNLRQTPFITIEDLFEQYPITPRHYPAIRSLEKDGQIRRLSEKKYGIATENLSESIDMLKKVSV